jgi:ComF family protein
MGVLQQAIYALKFGNYARLGRELGRHMAHRRSGELAGVDYLLPVPLHPARMRERGYNQSAEIAAGLSQVLGVPVRDGLVRRCVNTRQQARLDAGERRANLAGAFAPVSAPPAGARMGLVDDVLTTGATLESCARALAADRVTVIVVARPSIAETSSLS